MLTMWIGLKRVWKRSTCVCVQDAREQRINLQRQIMRRIRIIANTHTHTHIHIRNSLWPYSLNGDVVVLVVVCGLEVILFCLNGHMSISLSSSYWVYQHIYIYIYANQHHPMVGRYLKYILNSFMTAHSSAMLNSQTSRRSRRRNAVLEYGMSRAARSSLACCECVRNRTPQQTGILLLLNRWCILVRHFYFACANGQRPYQQH